jgi:hypothetical protein
LHLSLARPIDEARTTDAPVETGVAEEAAEDAA